MKIKKQITTTEEIEISLPYFSKNICHWYKIISDDMAIQVLFSDYRICGNVNLVNSSLAFNDDNEQCTEEEFNEKFDLVIQQLKTVKEK